MFNPNQFLLKDSYLSTLISNWTKTINARCGKKNYSFLFLYINLFIFGCVGSLLRAGFL